MNTITKWSPARELDNIQGNLFGFFGRNWPSVDWGIYSSYDWTPAVDVAEDEKGFTITADLPEVRREDIHVTLREGSLALSGERQRPEGAEEKTYHRSERAYGKFERSFYLPENTDPEHMKAEFKEGVLMVRIPKTPSSVPSQKEITIE